MKYFIFATFLLFIALPVQAADDAPKARAMLVLDASGSMWGQVEGKNKIVIAREVLADLMQDWDEGVYLGLAAYGHNRKGDCNDIETLVKVGPKTGDEIVKTVNEINPKGKTPLSAAVKRAAEELRYTEEVATVILLSDGIETCNLDPCAIGASLEEAGIDFTAHVIGFNVKIEDQKGLKCLAENTGGQFLSADNAGQLGAALKKIAADVRSGADTVYVIVDKNGARYDKDVRWDIFAVDDQGQPTGDALHSKISEFVKLREPGRFYVKVRVGQAVYGGQVIEAKKDEIREHEIDMRGGTFKLSGLMTQGQPIEKGDIYWYINVYKADGTLGDNIHADVGRNVVAELPPGKFQLHAKHYGAHQYVDLISEAGETMEMPVNFEAGYTKFIPSVNGQEPDRGIYYYIYTLDENGKRGAVSHDANVTSNNQVVFTLNAGRYQLEASHSRFETQHVDFEVKPGETTEHEVVFNAN